MSTTDPPQLAPAVMFAGTLARPCEKGENGWQKTAGLYALDHLEKADPDPLAIHAFMHVAGASPSFNNERDLDRCLQTITHIAAGFELNFGVVPLIAVVVKHGNCCGAAVGQSGESIATIRKMLEGDLQSISGGVVMVNFPIGDAEAEELRNYRIGDAKRRILDSIIAPRFSNVAIETLARKKDKGRFMQNAALAHLGKNSLDAQTRFCSVRGGLLSQPNYTFILNLRDEQMEVSSHTEPYDLVPMEQDMILAWAIGSTSNSNTITIVKGGMLLGNGVGQQSRVRGCKLAISNAQECGHGKLLRGATAYSDSFFPFKDGPEILGEAGIGAVFATTGSQNDDVVKAYFNSMDMTFYTLPDSVARGFFGH